MKHTLCVTLCCFLFSSVAFTQNNKRIEDLQQQLAVAKTDSAIVELTASIGFEMADADPRKAMAYYIKAEELSNKSGYRRGLLTVNLGKGAVMDFESKFDSAILYYTTGLGLAEKLNDLKWQSRFNINIGLIYLRQSKHLQAMEHYNKAQQQSEQAGDEKGVANALRKKANLVLQNLDYKRAKAYYRQSIEVYDRLKDSGNLGECYGSMGFAYRNEGLNDSAIYYFEKANVVFKALRYNNMIAIAYTEIGKAMYEEKHFKKALENYTAAVVIYDTLHYMAHQDALHVFIGDAYIDLKNADSASPHYRQALQLAQANKDMEQEYMAYYGLYKSSRLQSNFKEALGYFEMYDSVRDVVEKNEQMATVTEMTEKYEAEKKERTIQQQQFEITKKNYFIYGSLVLLLLVILLSYSYYRRYRLRQERKMQSEIIRQQDLATRAILQAEEAERHRIARELHDGVGQMMSAAKMNLSAIENEIPFTDSSQKIAFEKSMTLVDESCKEVRTVSHQMMPNALLKKGLASAVREFVDKIDHRILKVELYSEGLNERIDSNTETVLYRVVQECVNNVIKHSGANHLDISLIKDSDGISVTIEDNGKGFDPAGKEKDGIGLQNIYTRIAYLKGTVEFNSSPGNGTLVAIHVAG